MIVHDFHVVRPFIPQETDSPLPIDANAVLSRPITAKLFQPVRRRHLQIVHAPGSLQLKELAEGDALDRAKTSGSLPLKEPAGFRAFEGSDHREPNDTAPR